MSIFDKLMGPLFGGGSANSSGAVPPTSPTKTQAILTGLFGATPPPKAPPIVPRTFVPPPHASNMAAGPMSDPMAGLDTDQGQPGMPLSTDQFTNLQAVLKANTDQGQPGMPLSTDQFTNLQAVLKAIQGN